MFTIYEVDNYKLYGPPAAHDDRDPVAEYREMWHRNCAQNAEYIARHSQPLPQLPITGSFIYAHPPNYKAYNTLQYTKADWLRDLRRLQSYGIDTVIFQAALWSELQECYYRSKFFSKFKQWNVLEPMLEAANELNLQVFLGGYGSVTCWMDKLNNHTIAAEKERQLSCFKELMQYRDLFHGFYFTPESAYTGQRDAQREKFLHQLYGEFFDAIKTTNAQLKILMSPATFYYENHMDDMADAWNALLDGVGLDILAPQDTIGCSCIALPQQEAAIQQWKKIADANKIHLWSNVEVFDQKEPLGTANSRCTADPERIKVQIAHAAPYVEKLITWEALYYTDDQAGPFAAALREKIFNHPDF